MAKRKSDNDAPLPHKRTKLHHQIIHNGQTPDASILHDGALRSPPVSLASPERREKRRRTPDYQSDTFEEPETKRTRRSPGPSDSPDTASEPWPSIEYNPRKEEPCPLRQFINEMHKQDMLFHEEYDSDTFEDAKAKETRTSPNPSKPHAQEPWLEHSYIQSNKEATLSLKEYDSDITDEPETTGTRRSPNPSESPEPSSEPWASIEYNPRKEEPCPLRQFINEMHKQDMLLHEEYDSDTAADQRNPLPSPEPSDGDMSQNDGCDSRTVGSIQARKSTLKSSKLHSRQRPRKRDATPPRRKQRQPPKKREEKKKRNRSRDEAVSPAVETFLRSKRSSRRDPNCKLWHLGDDGTACTVSRVR
ncbi:hypothetical protein V8C42DRAFT_199438 [Trichoderma barbatum]